MPSLYKFDDYDTCIGVYQGDAKYCVVNTYIKPDNESELYRYIEVCRNILYFKKNQKLEENFKF